MKNLVNNIIAANQRIKAVDGGVRETPLDQSGIFSERTGASFLLKGEHLQRTGSFKMRGAMNKVLCLTEEERKKGHHYRFVGQSRHGHHPGGPGGRA